jgi:hypothetical protein
MWLEMIGIRVTTVSTDTAQVDTRCDALGKISTKRNKLENVNAETSITGTAILCMTGNWLWLAVQPAETLKPNQIPLPHSARAMTEAHIFIAALARAAKSRRQ